MTGNYGSEPEFDDDIVEQYKRASAEGFKRPPSAPLRQAEREKPFRWPGIDQRRDTIALQRDDLRRVLGEEPPVQQEATEEPEEQSYDQTEIAAHQTLATPWVLELIDGPLIAMPGTDVIVGRRPGTIPGCVPMTVDDPGRTLSKSHVRLTLTDDTWIIEDLGSTNGTALIHSAEDDEADLPEIVLAPAEPTEATDMFRLGTMRVRLRPIITQ